MVCSIGNLVRGGGGLSGDWCFRCEDHFADGSAGGDHRVDVFVGRDFDVEQVGAGIADRFLQRIGQAARVGQWCGP